MIATIGTTPSLVVCCRRLCIALPTLVCVHSYQCSLATGLFLAQPLPGTQAGQVMAGEDRMLARDQIYGHINKRSEPAPAVGAPFALVRWNGVHGMCLPWLPHDAHATWSFHPRRTCCNRIHGDALAAAAKSGQRRGREEERLGGAWAHSPLVNFRVRFRSSSAAHTQRTCSHAGSVTARIGVGLLLHRAAREGSGTDLSAFAAALCARRDRAAGHGHDRGLHDARTR